MTKITKHIIIVPFLLASLLAPFMLFAFDAGNAATDRALVDGYTDFTIVDTNNPFPSDGEVTEFGYYAENTNAFRIIVVDEGNQVEWVSEEITPVVGAGTHTPAAPVAVLSGWNLAVYSASSGVIPYDDGGLGAVYEPNNAGLPSVGETLTIEGTTNRTYSLNATLSDANGDDDGDGVVNGDDLCDGTIADNFSKYGDKTAKNRWMLNSADIWVTNAKAGTMGGFAPTIEETYGCSGQQILAELEAATGLSFGGEKKYGITKGSIEAWIAGEYHLGLQTIDTAVVDSANISGVDSNVALDDESEYFFQVSGTWTNRTVETVDAEYSNYNNLGWVDGPDGGYPADLIDLQVDNDFVSWGALSLVNEYELAYTPSADGVVNFRVFDGDANTNTANPGWYGDNIGTLTVNIVEDVWVDLW